jgi:hypothetical protein
MSPEERWVYFACLPWYEREVLGLFSGLAVRAKYSLTGRLPSYHEWSAAAVEEATW